MEKSKNADAKLKVYYDGLCRLCSYEINHYKKQDGADSILFVDITDPAFNAALEGLDPVLAHKYLHAKTAEGHIVTGVDSFKEIWKIIPKYNSWVKYCDNPALRPMMNAGYHLFAVYIRPYFQRRSDSCKTSPYCEADKV